MSDDGQTGVKALEELHEETCSQIVKNIAIGSGVILTAVTVSVMTKNPALSLKAGQAVKIIFIASSKAAKAGTAMALGSAGMSGAAGAITEAMQSGDPEAAAKAGLLHAGEGFKSGAIAGTVIGAAEGIRAAKHTHLFKPGSVQAKKYPDGISFTKGSDGKYYPRLEKYAKKQSDLISRPQAAQNHV